MNAYRRWTIGALALLPMLGALALPAQAQDYPTHPVRIITDSAPGSAIDVPVRIIADGLSKIWGQQAVVINQPGAGGAIAVRTAETATPDGYTLSVAAASAFVALPGTADNLPIQVPKDLVPVAYIGGAPMFITAAPWLGIKTLPDLIALAESKAVFDGKGQCLTCHAVSGNGSRVGPNLTEIGAFRRQVELERSLREPDAEIRAENRVVRAVTRDGVTITGRLLNQDTFALQLIDSNERLLSLEKANLREYAVLKNSLMPSYRDRLSVQEMTDLVSYLVSLRGRQ